MLSKTWSRREHSYIHTYRILCITFRICTHFNYLTSSDDSTQLVVLNMHERCNWYLVTIHKQWIAVKTKTKRKPNRKKSYWVIVFKTLALKAYLKTIWLCVKDKNKYRFKDIVMWFIWRKKETTKGIQTEIQWLYLILFLWAFKENIESVLFLFCLIYVWCI